ncbi:NADH-quinone oxidoreductase subunit L [Halococcus hamelinensis]|uniref:Proton-translocating NADH-quinone oxidoreductase, chain L n=1 Tax=Halococcus hamelinensis 100A6 TaxID=1132509 RepID=M0LV67_9EURY|nr:NADH-quinone oxidoreductase subunit L [Halococcus hamelinensis]EMA36274.1 proton-translocating NADH-quinone oxidoreductase, chain L [Halococcus hamelinensis 100A6]
MAALDYTPAIAVLPLVSFVIALFAGRFLPKKGAFAGIIATAGSLVLSAWTALAVAGGATTNTRLYTFAATGGFDLHLGVLIDPLAALMLLIVSLVSFLVHVFSLGFMNDENETGIPRYYAGLGLFTASMLGFVMADNLFMAFMFFEMVGFCSWLLIGHWFKRDAPASAAKKAFLVTRFGDYFLLVGLVGILATFGTASFAGQGSFPALAEAALSGNLVGLTTFGLSPAGWFSILGLLVLGGVIGKSAQFPLHTWLPDAMEGPTPVSALIHAATMVAAGVYLVARMYGFYALLPTVLAVIAFVGGFTALFAASMAVVKRDIKQVLAYSTISQYGYMTLALGAGGYTAAVFHLMTHAFFKALLFLGAGSVIIATHHTQDMWDLGGLKERLPTTYWTFVVASLALAGIFPFAGFWSKDEVLYEALSAGLSSPVILIAYAFGLIAVFVTGFYTLRMVLLTFHGEPRSDAARNAHGVGWSVKAPLVVLGVLAVVAGFVNMLPVAEVLNLDITYLEHWLAHGVGNATGEHYYELVEEFAGYGAASVSALLAAVVSLVVALAGAGLAYALYSGRSPRSHTDRLGALKPLLMHNYYQDEYQVWLANGTTRIARAVGTFDNGVVDGVVNGVSSISLFSGDRIKRLQTGLVTNYAALLSLGLVVLLVAFGLLGGWF